jgi:MerR family mercuric resistance operon transcriptional regulator
VLARRAGCNLETIRYYEKIGIMPEPARTEAGHRIYHDPDQRRLTLVLRLRDLGFSIEELREVLSLIDSDTITCGEVETITLDHIDVIKAKIRDLKVILKTLQDLVKKCDGGDTPDCGALTELFR